MLLSFSPENVVFPCVKRGGKALKRGEKGGKMWGKIRATWGKTWGNNVGNYPHYVVKKRGEENVGKCNMYDVQTRLC